MAAAGAPAARCLTILHLLVVILGQPGQALGLKGGAAAPVDPPSFEELTTSLVVNQLSILQLIQNVSNASGAAAETCTQIEARLDEEAAARDARLKETLVAGQQRCSQETLEALRATQETLTAAAETCTQNEARLGEEAAARDAKLKEALQETLTASGRAEVTAVREEMTALREEVRQQMDNFLQELHKLLVPACPNGWILYESSCYLFDGTVRSWEQSLAYCRGLSSDLVKITSAEENQFLATHMKGDTWLGLNRRDGHFVWADGSEITYNGWAPGQPANTGGDENCGHTHAVWQYKWDDWICSLPLYPVCEKPPVIQAVCV